MATASSPPGRSPLRWHSSVSNPSRSTSEPVGSTAARARSPGVTSASTVTRLAAVREEAAAYPVITGPRTLFEVETEIARLSLTYHHRSHRWTVTGLDEAPPGRLNRHSSGRPRTPSPGGRRWSVAGRVRRYRTRPVPDRRSPLATDRMAPPRRIPWDGLRDLARFAPLATLQSGGAVHPDRSLPRPDPRRVRRAARVGRAGARWRERLGGRGQPRRRARGDGRLALRGPTEVRRARGSPPVGEGRRSDARRPAADARRRRRRGLCRASPPR